MNNANIYYEKFGDPSSPVLILIPGLGGQLTSWPEDFINGLVEKNYHVLALDNRDSGLSEKYDDLGVSNLLEIIWQIQAGIDFKPPYTLDDMAEDIFALMKKLFISKAHLVGLSMGGIIAQLFAIKHPDLCLTLTCIGATTGDPALSQPKQEVLEHLFSPNRKIENIEDYIKDKLEMYKIYNHSEHIDEQQLRGHYIESFHRGYAPSGINRQMLAMICAGSRAKQLTKVFIPSLIIHGDHDPVFPLDHGRHLAKCLPNSKLKIINKLGHGLPECFWKQIVESISICC